MNFSIVVATGKNGEIGSKGKLLWNIPSDLKHFKDITTPSGNIENGGIIIMGRKTYESLPTYPDSLPNRLSIVLTTNETLLLYEYNGNGTVVYFEDLDNLITSIDKCEKDLGIKKEYFVIGGGSIYKQFLPLCNKIYLTEVDQEFPEADTYFKYNKGEFKVIEESEEKEENGFKFKFKTLERVWQD